jgi:hypothetical protein
VVEEQIEGRHAAVVERGPEHGVVLVLHDAGARCDQVLQDLDLAFDGGFSQGAIVAVPAGADDGLQERGVSGDETLDGGQVTGIDSGAELFVEGIDVHGQLHGEPVAQSNSSRLG